MVIGDLPSGEWEQQSKCLVRFVTRCWSFIHKPEIGRSRIFFSFVNIRNAVYVHRLQYRSRNSQISSFADSQTHWPDWVEVILSWKLILSQYFFPFLYCNGSGRTSCWSGLKHKGVHKPSIYSSECNASITTMTELTISKSEIDEENSLEFLLDLCIQYFSVGRM